MPAQFTQFCYNPDQTFDLVRNPTIFFFRKSLTYQIKPFNRPDLINLASKKQLKTRRTHKNILPGAEFHTKIPKKEAVSAEGILAGLLPLQGA
ncbi:hypothetical protein B0O44_101146 [Pedobacter nutrimenti]|uniref:Uncharacterized protein n=1 Tax=Pedobacter nutrimenti TaxID=1241337 RepID=A0A318URE7_9SPHI|nr:hypothetical protein B0O44_101146 [Pedobacter nutrimenti]